MPGLRRTGAPASEPVSLAAMKSHLNVEASFTDDDELIAGMISAAREDAEDYTGRSLVSQQWVFALDSFPVYRVGDTAPVRANFDTVTGHSFGGILWNHSQVIKIPQPPLQAVNAVLYTDLSTNVQLTLAATAYQVDAISEPGRLAPAFGTTWPLVAPVLNAVQIEFTSGYAEVPFRFQQAIKLRAAAYYENREEFLAGVATPIADWFERLLSVDRRNIFGLTYAG